MRKKRNSIPQMKNGKKHILFSMTFDGKNPKSEKDFCWHGCDKVSYVGGHGGGGS